MAHPMTLALQTAVPYRRYSQHEISSFYVNLLDIQSERRERAVHALFEQSGVEFRHSVVEETYFTENKTTEQRNALYMQEAIKLGGEVIRCGLERAGIAPHEISTFIVVSCTGFDTPGLDLHLARELGMRPNLSRTCILGMGCYAAFPAIRRALESVKAYENRLALVLTLELCTIHLQFDASSESMVSTSLFSDGTAMMLIGSSTTATQSRGPQIIDAETYCDYQTLDQMSFTLTDHGFRMYLSSYIPDLLAANIRNFTERLLTRNGLSCEDIKFWAIHPGSKKIVEHIQTQLGLTNAQIQFSLDILRDYGNMSSPTVLFVLERIMQIGSPVAGDYGVMMAFGPGLTMEALLVQWT